MKTTIGAALTAALATGAGGVAAVAAVPAGGAVRPDVRIEVRDDGPGFPEAFLSHAFEWFRRPDTGRSRDNGGAGLGLAVLQTICAAHGGRATASNKPGRWRHGQPMAPQQGL
jgi:signal transduction histidine kinase